MDDPEEAFATAMAQVVHFYIVEELTAIMAVSENFQTTEEYRTILRDRIQILEKPVHEGT
jgi:hypothetical protein